MLSKLSCLSVLEHSKIKHPTCRTRLSCNYRQSSYRGTHSQYRSYFATPFTAKEKGHGGWSLGGEHNSEIPKRVNQKLINLKYFFGILLVIYGTMFLFSVEEAIPYTSHTRRRYLPVSVEEKINQFMVKEVISEYQDYIVDPEHPMVQHLKAIGDHITNVNGLKPMNYVLIDTGEVNAFVVGGDTVFLFTGKNLHFPNRKEYCPYFKTNPVLLW
eukprot:TRINITY_DN211_c0_g2_i2.p1 TRINITY_DN211_c0_g2~~TRINITY_DN211_c0_g2_i2.p1  ORF type:complete len:214 (+),score=36.77 TRINITY_DN211_c0_g2_i2:36-677(+)